MMGKHGQGGQSAKAIDLGDSFHWYTLANRTAAPIVSIARWKLRLLSNLQTRRLLRGKSYAFTARGAAGLAGSVLFFFSAGSHDIMARNCSPTFSMGCCFSFSRN